MVAFFFKPIELSNCNSMLGLSLGVFLKAQFFEPQLMWSWSSGAAAAAGG
jgi:hypothetical protein